MYSIVFEKTSGSIALSFSAFNGIVYTVPFAGCMCVYLCVFFLSLSIVERSFFPRKKGIIIFKGKGQMRVRECL